MGRPRRYALSGKQEPKCKEYVELFLSKNNLIDHHPVHIEQRQYKCIVSSATTPSTRNRGEYRCIECGKFYSTESVLILHYNIHRLYLRYRCTECHEYFLSKNDLSVHSHRTDAIREMSGNKCKVCDKCFIFKCELLKRELKHKKHLRNKREVCDKGFTSRGYLKKHYVTHADHKS
uniref:C2H2-type domain-containing protein n=1 Tax=Timema genevievae TaxID=629358 RepID=A0A7R9KC01_TIMGE|nr:unnamed protein product [Timema genevievae]